MNGMMTLYYYKFWEKRQAVCKYFQKLLKSHWQFHLLPNFHSSQVVYKQIFSLFGISSCRQTNSTHLYHVCDLIKLRFSIPNWMHLFTKVVGSDCLFVRYLTAVNVWLKYLLTNNWHMWCKKFKIWIFVKVHCQTCRAWSLCWHPSQSVQLTFLPFVFINMKKFFW